MPSLHLFDLQHLAGLPSIRNYTLAANLYRAAPWTGIFLQAAKEYDIPLAVLLAVANRETGIVNTVGDSGHGHGIMQIDDRYHSIARKTNKNIELNIRYGAWLLHSYYLEVSAKFFEWSCVWWLRGAIVAYNSGVPNVRTQEHIDHGTTGNNYSEDVLLQARWLMTVQTILSAANDHLSLPTTRKDAPHE